MAVAGILLTTVGVGAFLAYSYAKAFANWPWTQSTVIDAGTLYGLTIGENKTEVRKDVAAGLAASRFSSLDSLRISDPPVPEADAWFVGIAACNCWLELHFSNEALRLIRSRRYYGPSE